MELFQHVSLDRSMDSEALRRMPWGWMMRSSGEFLHILYMESASGQSHGCWNL